VEYDNWISWPYDATRNYDAHYSCLSYKHTIGTAIEDRRKQPLPEVVNLVTRIAQAGELNNSAFAQAQLYSCREAKDVDTAGGNVLAHLARKNFETSLP